MKNHMRVVWLSFAFAVALFIVAPMAMSAPTFKYTPRSGHEIVLRLLDSRCSNAAVLKHLLVRVPPDYLDRFKDARLRYEGKDWASCWFELDGMVYSIDEEGAPLQPIPRDLFRDGTV